MKLLDTSVLVGVEPTRDAADAASALWATRPNLDERPDVGDVLVAGTAEASGLPLVMAMRAGCSGGELRSAVTTP